MSLTPYLFAQNVSVAIDEECPHMWKVKSTLLELVNSIGNVKMLVDCDAHLDLFKALSSAYSVASRTIKQVSDGNELLTGCEFFIVFWSGKDRTFKELINESWKRDIPVMMLMERNCL